MEHVVRKVLGQRSLFQLLTSWSRPTFPISFILICTNNVPEYEALVLGLQILKRMQAKRVYIYRDFELVLRQVIGTYQAKYPRMRDYENLTLDILEFFDEYQIFIIPRSQNVIADTFAVAANTFRIPIHPNTKYTIEVKHRLAIPDNVKYWQVFEDDDHIESFLTLSDDYENMAIGEEEEGDKITKISAKKPKTEAELLTHLGDKEIIQLKNNSFPKGLVPLEELFDHNYVVKTPGVVPSKIEVEDFNIGTTNDLKYIKISKNMPEKARVEYLALLKKYTKVFSWRYQDLKVYDTYVIQHTIPIKEDAKPFK